MCFMADLRLNVPQQRQGATEAEKINDLYRFAGELTKQVRMVLNNLDIDSFGAETQAKIRKAVEVSEVAERNLKEQKDLIYSNADYIYQNMETLQKTLSGQITAVADNLVAETDARTEYEAHGAGVKISSIITERLGNLLNINVQADEDGLYDTEQVSVYNGLITMGYEIDNGEYSITIAGRRDGQEVVKARFTPEKLAFYQDNVELGYFAAKRQWNTQSQTSMLAVTPTSKSDDGFIIDTDADGNLRIRFEEAIPWENSSQLS